MKKIMFVIHALGYGGAGKMIVYLANQMSKMGYEVVIYVEEQIGVHYDIEPSIDIYQETEFFKNYYTRRFRQIFQLRKRVAEIKPDIVISFQTNQNALAVLATRGRNIPVIVSERGDPYQYHNIVAKLKTAVINHAEGGVFQTARAMAYFGKKLQKRSRVIYNPSTITFSERPKWEERINEIAFVARFDIHQKRQDVMIRAFAKVAKEIPDIRLAFYGEGEEQAVIEKMASELGIQGRVCFKGLVRNVPEAIRSSKLFILTSDFEGMPNALIEAMAVGLPCISTDCSPGGAAELIKSGQNGILVPCGDEKAIADAAIDLLKNPQKADAYGAKAQDIICLLSPENIFGQWKNYIEEVLSR